MVEREEESVKLDPTVVDMGLNENQLVPDYLTTVACLVAAAHTLEEAPALAAPAGKLGGQWVAIGMQARDGLCRILREAAAKLLHGGDPMLPLFLARVARGPKELGPLQEEARLLLSALYPNDVGTAVPARAEGDRGGQSL